MLGRFVLLKVPRVRSLPGNHQRTVWLILNALFKVGAVGGEFWDQARLRLVEEITAEFGPLPEGPPESDAVLWYVAGLVFKWIKAAGGVRTLDDLLKVRALGVTRIGATATEAMLNEAVQRGFPGPKPAGLGLPGVASVGTPGY